MVRLWIICVVLDPFELVVIVRLPLRIMSREIVSETVRGPPETNAVAIVAPPECVLWIVAPETDANAGSVVKADYCLGPILASDTHAPEFCARLQVWRT